MASVEPQRRPLDYFCGEVLRLPPGMSDPDHYTLLGLAYFENDHDVILRAALERIGLLEACAADPRPEYRKACQLLVASVRAAQLTLLDACKRREYDEGLIGRSEQPDAAPAAEDEEVELAPGTMLMGRYRILGQVRRGGLGVVFDSLDSNLRSRVHVSILRPKLSSDRTARRRIECTARAAAALDHPGILRMDEVGDASGLLFSRSRAPEGRNLFEMIEATPKMRLEPAEARRIGAGIAAALAHAHSQRVVHGDLHPTNVFVTGSGRVLVADFGVSRAVADLGGGKRSLYRAPDGEATEAGDLFALGALLYQMLAGMPPFLADSAKSVPRPLPEDVPEELEEVVTGLLARSPEQRPGPAAEVAVRLAGRSAPRRLRVLFSVAAVLIVALVAALMSRGTQPPVARTSRVTAGAWQLIAGKRYGEAIDTLRRALEAEPGDGELEAALASALAGKAERSRDVREAQRLLAEAHELEPLPGVAARLDAARKVALAELARVKVSAPAVSAAPIVTVDDAGVPLESVAPKNGTRLELKEGAHEVPYRIEDTAGNVRTGTLPVVVDTIAPVLEFLDPADGALLEDGAVRVRIRFRDANPPATIDIRGRAVALSLGVAETVFHLDDGEHRFDVAGADRAGHAAAPVSRTVTVNSRAPDLVLERKEFVTADGDFTVRGRASPGARVTIDGRAVAVAGDGSFQASASVDGDGLVTLEATGPTGFQRRASVRVVLDRVPPAVAAVWRRRDGKGRLLYGTREMVAGALVVPLRVEDRTDVALRPSEGEVRDGAWRLAPHQGARRVTLRATDLAGNETALVLGLEGHRATPHLAVKCATEEYTSAEEALLEIEADGPVQVQGGPGRAGRVKIPLGKEGRLELVVATGDRYGNEARWTRVLFVDRTPPELTLLGAPERGIGGQELVIEADEEISTITCVGRTFEVNGRTARFPADLKHGRRRLYVEARDRAGNVAKVNFPLSVRNRVLVLDGKSAVKVDLPTRRLEKFTVECWVRGQAATGRAVVLAKQRGSAFGIFWSSADRSFPYAAMETAVTGFLSLPARKSWKWEEWVHLAFSYDGKRARFHVNGSLRGAVAMDEPLAHATGPLYVGAQPDSKGKPSGFFRGAIDEVRISSVARYLRAFTPARFHREDDSTVLLLRFDTRDGERFPDRSGRNRHGEPHGNPVLEEETR